MKPLLPILFGLVLLPSVVFSQISNTEIQEGGVDLIAATSSDMIFTGNVVKEKTLSLQEIISAEEAYFKESGRYVQILSDNRLPHYEKGIVGEKLGGLLPKDASVDVYDGPKGRGFVVNYIENGVRYAVGYGPDAALFSRSYTPYKASGAASSTLQSDN